MEDSKEKIEVNGLEAWRKRVLGSAYDEELQNLSETRDLFDVDSIVKHSKKTQKLQLPTLGAFIQYKPLRIIDVEAIDGLTHPNPALQKNLRNRMKVWKLIERVESNRFTKEDIDNLPANVIDTILMEYASQEEERFLLPLLKRRRDGFNQTLEPSK
jgi:hypothetical protein